MAYTVQSSREDPLVDMVVDDPDGGPRKRITVLSGVVAVASQQAGAMRVYVRGQQPAGDSVGFYVPGCPVLPSEGDITAHAEASLSQVVVNARVDNVEVAYGVGDVKVQLVSAPDRPGRWVYLSFMCHGLQPIGVRYRVTLQRPA
ncbi:MAG TPA: hypothetical protein VF855_06720 [Acidimicrobiales bacterium]